MTVTIYEKGKRRRVVSREEAKKLGHKIPEISEPKTEEVSTPTATAKKDKSK